MSERASTATFPKSLLIIGGGIIGLSVGWQLARAGCEVKIFERDKVGHGASLVSAGMLAPRTEAGFEDQELLQLNLESLRRYPEFLKELETDSGKTVSLQTKGTLMVALERDELERLKIFFDFRKQLGLAVEWLTGVQAREKEPLLSSHVIAAVYIPDDLRVEPKELLFALTLAFQNRGGKLYENRLVEKIFVENAKATGILTQEGIVQADLILISAGCWSSQIAGIPEEVSPPIRPVKGQIIRLETKEESHPSHIIRSQKVYLVPGKNNELLVGATSEEMGYDQSPGTGPLLSLLEEAFRVVPSIYETIFQEIRVGLRPTSRDHWPILGETSLRGLYYATGHYRHGVLLAPISAYAMSELILKGSCPLLAPFHPSRFQMVEAKQA